MRKEWESFRITIVLYLIVLALPFSAYFIYDAFKTIEYDTQTISKAGSVGGKILKRIHEGREEVWSDDADRIGKILEEVGQWVRQNNGTGYYVGSRSLERDFEDVNRCWSELSVSGQSDGRNGLQCSAYADHLATMIEKITYLKQRRVVTILFASIGTSMLISLLMIYFTRTYIHLQMRKHAIRDHDTGLFNYAYFMSSLKNLMSRSKRNKYPLSMIAIELNNLDKGNKTYDIATRKHLFSVVGGIVIAEARQSDLPCRYNDNTIMIILPDTAIENTGALSERIESNIKAHDFDISPTFEFKIASTAYDFVEIEKAFVERMFNQLKNTMNHH